MGYIIKLKGKEADITVDDVHGQKLLLAWREFQESRNNGPIDVKGFYGTLSDIKNIVFEKSYRKAEQDTEGDFKVEHKRIRELPPKEKALRSGFLKILHYAFTKKRLEDETVDFKKKLVDIQLKFFIDNPKRIHPDPILFKEIYGAINKVDENAFRIIQHTIQRDAHEAKFV